MKIYRIDLMTVKDENFCGEARELVNLNVDFNEVQRVDVIVYQGKKKFKVLKDRYDLLKAL